MPKTKFQNVVFTIIMATVMVYGMIVYNVSLNTGGMHGENFLLALHEMPIMVPIAALLEFFVVERLATRPVMSLIATLLFKTPSFAAWIHTWALNMPMALIWQLLYCGPLVRLIFRTIFRSAAK